MYVSKAVVDFYTHVISFSRIFFSIYFWSSVVCMCIYTVAKKLEDLHTHIANAHQHLP